MANGYRNALVQQIKDAGQELINRAESMVHPENDLITDFSIVIHFEQHEVPTIDYTTSVVNKVACDRLSIRKENPMSQKYDEYLEKHRQAVKKAYQWIAAYIPELTDVEATRNIEFHDMSKNTPDEYTPYDNYFYGEQTPAIIEAFNRAWLMHIHRNPHHWQYWVLINDEPKEGTILIEMPYPYIIEMICDWWAFSWIKGDLSEMFAWYKDHADYIKLHNNTRSIVEEILEMIRTKLTEVENAEN